MPPPQSAYRRLDPDLIHQTAGRLAQRIAERFPDSGLSGVAGELALLCRKAADDAPWFGRPHRGLRLAVGAGILLGVLVVLAAILNLHVRLNVQGLSDLVQAIEALINDLVFLGVGIYFLATWETRRKRARALAAFHHLRALAHIIDMHQLTKDPELIRAGGPDTAASPLRAMSPFELAQYLDYCSELLALASKAAALYVQEFDDPVTLAAVNEIENLAAGLSRKIWQKIMILDRNLDHAPLTVRDPAPGPPARPDP